MEKKHEYLKYDEFGLREVDCMSCGTPVAMRSYTEVPNKADPTQKVNVLALKRLSNWRQTKLNIEIDGKPGAYIEPILCVECLDKEFNVDRVIEQVKWGWQKGLEIEGRSQEVIKEQSKKFKKIKKGV